jgi:hypothetical protein
VAPSEWTVATLKEHLDALREADQKLADERHDAYLRAIAVAAAGETKRIDAALAALTDKLRNLNELRDVVTEIMTHLVTREEFSQARDRDKDLLNTGDSKKDRGYSLQISVVAIVLVLANFVVGFFR